MGYQRPHVFVSATAAEMDSSRWLVKRELRDFGYDPIEQTEFPRDYHTVRKMLRERILACDAVIHLAGACYGDEPMQSSTDSPRRSYAQLEYDVAVELRKPLYVLICELGFNRTEDDERQKLQQQHRDALCAETATKTVLIKVRSLSELKKRLVELLAQREFRIQQDEISEGRSQLKNVVDEIRRTSAFDQDSMAGYLTSTLERMQDALNLFNEHVKWVLPGVLAIFAVSAYLANKALLLPKEQSVLQCAIFVIIALLFFGLTWAIRHAGKILSNYYGVYAAAAVHAALIHRASGLEHHPWLGFATDFPPPPHDAKNENTNAWTIRKRRATAKLNQRKAIRLIRWWHRWWRESYINVFDLDDADKPAKGSLPYHSQLADWWASNPNSTLGRYCDFLFGIVLVSRSCCIGAVVLAAVVNTEWFSSNFDHNVSPQPVVVRLDGILPSTNALVVPTNVSLNPVIIITNVVQTNLGITTRTN